MERKTYLNRYRLSVDRLGLPFIIRRSADEAMFQASDHQSGEQVAVQVMPGAAYKPADRDQLAAEARAAGEINHPNIPQLRDFGFESDQLVYVTDYLEGTTAEEWIRTKGPMPASVALRITAQVTSALVAAGLHGIVHYAVYPGNILLAPGETAAGDWPLIKLINLLGVVPSTSSNGFASATLNPADFASPEQLENRPLNFRSEIYSLGCTLWFLLKGTPLIGGAEALPEANDLSAPIRELLVGMLAKNPAARPSDPLAIQQQIQNCLGQIERQDVTASVSVVTAPAHARTEVKILPQRRSTWRPLALAAVLVALAMLVALLLKQRAPQLFARQDTTITAEKTTALPSDALGENKEAPPTEEATEPPNLNVVTRAEEREPSQPAPVAAVKMAPLVLRIEKDVEPVVALAEVAPPAEGPTESEPASVEIFPSQSEAAAAEEPRPSPSVAPAIAAAKISPARAPAKPQAKKASSTSASSSRRRGAPAAPERRSTVVVGHIFPESR